VITESAAIIETDDVYVVHPCMHALWLPAGVYHSIFLPRPFCLHALYFAPRTVRAGADTHSRPQVLGLNNLARELVLFLCEAPRVSQRGPRHAHALTLLAEGKSIGEVARAVGYDSAAAFSTALKQCFGVSPSSYASNGG